MTRRFCGNAATIGRNLTAPAGATVTGGITNAGMLSVTAGTSFPQAFGIEIGNGAGAGANGGTLIGDITNSGILTATVSGAANGNAGAGATGIRISLATTGVGGSPGIFQGNILNSGTMTVSANGVGLAARGIDVDPGTFQGSITNSGVLTAMGTNGATGTAINITSPVSGGITNTGTLMGSTAAIDLTQEVGGGTNITQAGGMLVGNIFGSGKDTLAVTGGSLVLAPTSRVNGLAGFTMGPGGTLALEVTPTQAPLITVAGAATLNGGTVQVNADPGTYTVSTRYTILTANGGVNGTFARLLTSANFAVNSIFVTPTLSYDANDVFLGLAQAPFTSVALTRNQFASASAAQLLGAGNPVFNAIFAQTTAFGAQQAFDALSGEIHASAVTAAFEDQRLPREAILDRLSGPLETPLLGVTSTMTGAYAADLPTRKPALAPVAVQMVQPRLFGLWGQGFGDWGTTGSDRNVGAAKLSRDTGGFIIGADAERQFLNGTWRFGVAGGYTDDSLKVSARQSSGDYQSIFGALYGKASYGAIDLKAGAILASTDTHTSRSIIFPGFFDAAGSSYGGYAAQGFGELGYNLPFHWTFWSYVPGLDGVKANYEPFLQGAVIHIDQDRYVESALTGAALVGAAKGYDLGTTTLGLRTQYQLASLPGFTLSTLWGWRHAFGDVRPSVAQAFAGSFASFTVAGVPVDRNALVTQTALDYAVSNSVTVGLSYSGQYGSRATDNAFKGHVDVSFW
jgi:uncharacterized protein with beta-barrel porin domain